MRGTVRPEGEPETADRTTMGVEEFRAFVRSIIAAQLPADWAGVGTLADEARRRFLTSWRATLAEHHLLAPGWPVRYGGCGGGPFFDVVVAQELAAARAPTLNHNDMIGLRLLGNTILHIGTEEQRQTLLPRMVSGEDVWCQGFSEPDAGSDLASVRTRAELDGGEWRLNGQKIWTTVGHLANRIFVLARTNTDVLKHRGLTMFLLEADQPGIEMRPIPMLTGEHEFNEVFYNDALCPSGAVLGEVNGGWRVAMTLLEFERGESAASAPAVYRDELSRLIAVARANGKLEDRRVRDRFARAETRVKLMELTGAQMIAEMATGRSPGPRSAMFKLMWSEHSVELTNLAVDVYGADGLTPSGRRKATTSLTDLVGAPSSSMSWVTAFLHARSNTIAAGTSEIQRNIIAKNLLGLPDDPT